jgi:hypothetical protein
MVLVPNNATETDGAQLNISWSLLVSGRDRVAKFDNLKNAVSEDYVSGHSLELQ